MLFFSDKPICGYLHRIVQGVGRDQTSKIICPVTAHPPPTSFSWTFNSSLETHTVSIFMMNKQTLFENKSLLGTVLQHKRKMYGCNHTLRKLSL